MSIAAGCLLLCGVAHAQATEAKPWYESVKVNGLLSASYTHNYNYPDSQLNQLRVFDFHANKLTFDMGEILVQRAAERKNDWGFRVDFAAGSSQPEVCASPGMFRDSTGEAGDVDIHQLFISYIAPVGTGLRLDAGKFVTHLGYEVIEGYDGYNDNASRSFLFGFGGPFTHTGVRASYTFDRRWSAVVMLVQGSDVVKDNNSSKSVGAQLAIAATSKWTLYINYLGGAEQSGNNHDLRHTYNVVNVYKASPKLTLVLDTLYAAESDALAGSGTGSWAGGATFARYDLTDRWALAGRVEMFADKYGLRTGTAQRLTSFVLTPEYKIPLQLRTRSSSFVIRGDLRFDHSNQSVFQTHSDFRQRQVTTSVNVLYRF